MLADKVVVNYIYVSLQVQNYCIILADANCNKLIND